MARCRGFAAGRVLHRPIRNGQPSADLLATHGVWSASAGRPGHSEPGPEAVRNRGRWMVGMLRAAVANAPSGERVRVASIGCGPAWEVLTLANEHPEDAARLSLVMLDQDARALEHVRAMLKSIPGGEAMDTSFVAADVEALTDEGHTLQALGCPALIYSSGLFDYFSDAVFARYASALYRALPRGGRLVIGNLSVTNPSRWTMEFVTDWYVFHRSREDLQRLGGTLQPTPRVVSVDSEPLGANLFLVVDR